MARIIRRNGDEYEVKVKHRRDIKMILANDDPDFEILGSTDGGRFVVIYDASALRPNKVATELLPALAAEHEGTVCGDIVVMEKSHFDRLGGKEND